MEEIIKQYGPILIVVIIFIAIIAVAIGVSNSINGWFTTLVQDGITTIRTNAGW